jgi:hypothetical protein
MAVDVIEDPQVKEKSKKKEPSPLSMRTGDMLAQLESASPIAASSMMRALGDVERQRTRNEPGFAVLHHRQEAKIDGQVVDDTPLSKREWAQKHYGKQLAKYPVKDGMRRGVPRALAKQIREGHALYYQRFVARVESRQAGALSQAKIGTERARALSYGQANQPNTIASYIARQLQAGGSIDPQAITMWNAKHSQLSGLESKEGIASRGLAAEVSWRGKDREAAMARSQSDRQGRMNIAMLKEGVEKPLIADAPIRSVIVAGRNIGKVGKGGEKVDFETWMLESYLPIVRSITPEQRATIRKGMGDRIPPEAELLDMIEIPSRTPEKKGFWVRDVAEQPATKQAVEGGFDRLDLILEALRLRGVSDAKIDQLRAMYSGQLETAGKVPGG